MNFERGGDAAQRLREHIPRVRDGVALLGTAPYGLDPSWAGPRWLAANQRSSGGRPGETRDEYVSIELAHGAHRDHGPLLLVETARHRLDGNVPVVHSWELDDVMAVPGQTVSVTVDEVPVQAESWRRRDLQLVTFRAGALGLSDVRVTVRARAWADLADLALVSVEDVEPYLQGREIMLFRRRR